MVTLALSFSRADFLLKETSMIDRLKKQYQVIKQTLETLDISNALKQSLMVEWTNLNQGYSSLYSSMKSRLEDARQVTFLSPFLQPRETPETNSFFFAA